MGLQLRKIFCIFFFFIYTSIYGQEEVYISGNVVGATTGSPLPYATIFLKHHTIGTTSDTDGYFTLSLPDSVLIDTISFSYIGYGTIELVANSVASPLSVSLPPQTITLDNVDVSPLTPRERLLRVNAKAKGSYLDTAHTLSLYYQAFAFEDQEEMVKSQVLADLYRGPYFDTSYVPSLAVREGYKIVNEEGIRFFRENTKELIEEGLEEKEEELERALSQSEIDSIRGFNPIVAFFSQGVNPINMLTTVGFEQSNDLPEEELRKKIDEFESVRSLGYTTYQGYEVEKIEIVTNEAQIVFFVNDDDAVLSIQLFVRIDIPWYASSFLALVQRVGIHDGAYIRVRMDFRPIQSKWYMHSVRFHAEARVFERYWFSSNQDFEFVLDASVEVQDIKLGTIAPADRPGKLIDPKKGFIEQLGEYDPDFWIDYNIKNNR